MSETIIQIEHLSKRYRIGAHESEPVSWRKNPQALIGASFSYLRQMLRPPTDEETLWALRDVSVEVKQGEVLGVIGRNGAGKSTLLKILSRITEPTLGRAIIGGRIGSLLEVGTGFHPELTGRENIYLNGAILGMRRREIERKFDEIVEFAGIGRMIDTPVKRYSSGMYVRLAFAVAAHLEPEILIVDEVLAVGDMNFQKKCLGKMEEVAQSGRTVLFVSHNMPAVSRLCTRALLLETGQLAEDGPVAQVMLTYLANTLGVVSERQWPNLKDSPGSEDVHLVYVGVLDSRGQGVSNISVEESIQVKLRYFVGQPDTKFRCAVVFTTQGIVAFSTTEPTEINHPAVGYYESIVTIPGNLLAEGEYSLNVSLFSSKGVKHRYVALSEIVGFHVYDPLTGASARGDYTEAMSGVVRPLLSWQFEPLGANG